MDENFDNTYFSSNCTHITYLTHALKDERLHDFCLYIYFEYLNLKQSKLFN